MTKKEDIKMILENFSTDEINDLIEEIKNRTREEKEEEMRAAVAKHTELVGKCFKVRVKPHSEIFPEMWRYYKIISARASNEYRISALRFDEYPTYWFNYQSSKAWHPGDYYFGHYDFDSIIVEDCFFYSKSMRDNLKFIEITPTEYYNAMTLYINRLQRIEWPADHYRFGNKKPGDPDWERKESK